jgi:8-oxo-dGTP pyrophosphatase MutT (NUDIX family)
MKYHTFIETLRTQLREPLPGLVAHAKMAPSNRLENELKPNERTRRSAVLILFYPHQDQIYLPLILRPMYDGVHGGQMAFPGGRYENIDKDLTQTALREAQEEIGVKAADVIVLGQLSEIFIPLSNFLALPVIGYLPYRPDFYPDSREVDTVFEVNINEITDETILGMMQMNVRGVEIHAPYYEIQKNKIWGATAVMISELLDVVAMAITKN